MVNAASAEALWNLLTNRRIERWEPRRAPGDDGPERREEPT
jgi:hypothetical protein